ncbi:MAG: transcriptional regulator [Acidobacteria bacterium]|nr:transcriptional regulator [Acidobacteriota bacterium]
MTTTLRQQIGSMLAQPRTLSSIAHELGVTRPDVEEHVRHLLKSARASGRRVSVEPARCRSCGFRFDESKLTKPSKCPDCKGSHVYEPLIQIAP